MKNIFSGFLLLVCFSSFNLSTGGIPPPPSEPCTNFELWRMPLVTHGFSDKKYDTVVIQTYRKKSNFNSLIENYKVPLRAVNDNLRQTRNLYFPKEITTDFDLKIIFNDSLEYEITAFKTDWVARWCSDFCGYECTITSFKLNGIVNSQGSNIFIKEPSFKYSWEK